MPRFLTNTTDYQPISDGTYVLKILTAVEKVSERGNEMLVMNLSLPDGRSLPCILTFVEAARPVINAFCSSAGLLKPPGDGIEVELKAEHCRGRYLYASVANDAGELASDLVPRVSRFLTREQALIKNPELARIALQPQAALALKPYRTGTAL